jgi:hypothetical protein
MSTASTPYQLNPNLSCVDRVRRLFSEIVRRRLLTLARQRPAASKTVNEWVADIQINTLPCFMIHTDTLRTIWATINRDDAIRDFIFGLCFEVRQRCFESDEDYQSYIELVAQSITQFNDELSTIDEDTLKNVGLSSKVKDLLGGNSWAIPILLFEQFTAAELGLDIAIVEQETAANAKPEATD